MTIDLHCHSYPEPYLRLLRHEGAVDDVVYAGSGNGDDHLLVDGGRQRLPLTARMCSPTTLLEAMDSARVEMAVLSPASSMYHYGAGEAQALRVVRAINEGFAAMAADAPQRLRFFATVPLQHPALAVAELAHAVDTLGAVGVSIATNVAGVNLDDPAFLPFFERVHDRNLTLFIHPANVVGADRLSRHFLGNLVGNPVDTAIAVASLIFGGVMERLPRLKVVVCHGGGVLPSLRGRWRHGALAKPAIASALSMPPDGYIDRLHVDTITHDARTLRLLVDTMSDENVVLGSDYPFEMGDPSPLDSVEAIPGLSDSSRAKILGGNAARLIGMDTAAP